MVGDTYTYKPTGMQLGDTYTYTYKQLGTETDEQTEQRYKEHRQRRPYSGTG